MTVLTEHLLERASHGYPPRTTALRYIDDPLPHRTLHVNRAPLEVEIRLLESDDLAPTKARIASEERGNEHAGVALLRRSNETFVLGEVVERERRLRHPEEPNSARLPIDHLPLDRHVEQLVQD